MTKIVPVQLDNGTVLYIEAQDDTATSPMSPQAPIDETIEQRRGGAKGIGDPRMPFRPTPTQSMQMVQSTIRTYTTYCLDAFKHCAAANVDEVTLEFGVNLSADAGIPYIASGKAQSNLKITVKCSYNKPEADAASRPAEATINPVAPPAPPMVSNGQSFVEDGQRGMGDRF